MKILFIHQNFPGQFRQLAPALAAAGHEVHALAIADHGAPGVVLHRYGVKAPAPGEAGPHPWLRDAQAKVLRGQAAMQAMAALDTQGFVPDLVVANPGWGEALCVKDVWPHTRLLCLMEFFYAAEGLDAGFDPEFTSISLDDRGRLRLKNLALLEALLSMDAGVAPTRWQHDSLPEHMRSKVGVIFDGIDTDMVRPDPGASIRLGSGLTLRAGDPVLSFVSRNLEPYRGFHVFMRALPELLARSPEAHVVIVGGDGVSYGAAPAGGGSWRRQLLAELRGRLDMSRLHFVGRVAYRDYLQLLQVSAVHCYLTYPFVLSWSCIEAMSAGCHVVGSRTAPVTEFIEHGRNGSLVDFFDTAALANALAQGLAQRADLQALRQRARDTAIERCDFRRVALPAYQSLIASLAPSRGAPRQ